MEGHQTSDSVYPIQRLLVSSLIDAPGPETVLTVEYSEADRRKMLYVHNVLGFHPLLRTQLPWQRLAPTQPPQVGNF